MTPPARKPRESIPSLVERSSKALKCASCDSLHKGFFCNSSDSTLRKVDEEKSDLHFKAGETIFQAGDDAQGIYCLRNGAVKIESCGENGETHILHIVNAGGVLGLRASLDGEPFEAAAVALQPTDVCFISKEAFASILQEDPKVAMNALRRVTVDLHEMEKRFCHATDLSAVERIAEALLHLKDRFESQQWSRKEFAEWASTTSETVIRTLSQFEKEGLIRLDGKKIIILDRKRLLERAKIFV